MLVDFSDDRLQVFQCSS